jgi:hypothetical protein
MYIVRLKLPERYKKLLLDKDYYDEFYSVYHDTLEECKSAVFLLQKRKCYVSVEYERGSTQQDGCLEFVLRSVIGDSDESLIYGESYCKYREVYVVDLGQDEKTFVRVIAKWELKVQ